MKIDELIQRLADLRLELGASAEVVIYDTDAGEFVRDLSATEIEAVEATENIIQRGGQHFAMPGDIVKLDDVTRPLVEGKSKPIRVVELMI